MTLRIPAEAWPGLVLMAAAIAAVAIVNSPLGDEHEAVLKTVASVGYGESAIAMPLSNWVKNALMAVFFFFVGLELKRELMEGELSSLSAASLPAAGAVGGMAIPAVVYLALAGGSYREGWAIPAATDIAFALGVLSLLGSRVPAALKAFLLAVAVVDDLGAILIVAFVYTSGIEVVWLAWAAAFVGALAVLNRFRVRSIAAYVLVAAPLWVAVQNSGVNPTLAGVVAAAFIPMRDRRGGSPLHDAEDGLRPWVLFGVMPVFALANAGVSFAGGFAVALTHPVALGIAFGLALGKPIGVAAAAILFARVMKAKLPGRPLEILGVGCIAGIGFTMSLFIGALAFLDPGLQAAVRVGVYIGSLGAASLGVAILLAVLPKHAGAAAIDDPTRPFLAEEPQAQAAARAQVTSPGPIPGSANERQSS
jgi:NhaA family Na+:H+ antiporter